MPLPAAAPSVVAILDEAHPQILNTHILDGTGCGVFIARGAAGCWVDGLLFGEHGRAVWWLSRTSGAPVALQIMDSPDRGALVRVRLDAVAADQLPGYFLAPYGPTPLERLAIALRLLPYSRMP